MTWWSSRPSPEANGDTKLKRRIGGLPAPQLPTGQELIMLLVVVGCILVILTEQSSANDVAAFGLLGVVIAYLIRDR